jgi:hypothetical protein
MSFVLPGIYGRNPDAVKAPPWQLERVAVMARGLG